MKERIEILQMANLIDDVTKDTLFSVKEKLDNQFKLKLTEENGSIMITHLGRALMRAKRGEIIKEINSEVFSEIRESENFEKVKEIYKKISEDFESPLPQNEVDYMYANLLFLIEG